jgi:hypothetical protein
LSAPVWRALLNESTEILAHTHLIHQAATRTVDLQQPRKESTMRSNRLLVPAVLALAAVSAQAQSPQAARPTAAQRTLEPITVTAPAPRAHDPFSPFVYDVMGLNAPIRVDLVRAWFKQHGAAAPQVAAQPATSEPVRTAQALPARS